MSSIILLVCRLVKTLYSGFNFDKIKERKTTNLFLSRPKGEKKSRAKKIAEARRVGAPRRSE
jgi:hypothetical protein